MIDKQTCTLYNLAVENDILIVDLDLHGAPAISVMDEDCNCCIGIDYQQISDDSRERVVLAHELGHCIKGAFYNRYSPYDIKSRHEYRADVWAIKELVDIDALRYAIELGYTELWELADYFSVTEDFMRKAVEYYQLHSESFIMGYNSR